MKLQKDILMNRTERHIVRLDKNLEDLCFKSARLYNFCNYHLRQAHFGKMQRPSEYEMSSLLCEFNQYDFRNLPSITSQQTIRYLYQTWSSFYKSLKDYKKNPKKYNRKPKIPKYKKKNGLGIVLFTGQQVKLKNNYIHFPKKVNINPIKTKVDNVRQVRIVPQATCFVIEIVYKKQEVNYDLNKNNYLSIDLGIDNLITATNNVGNKSFIINGKPLKSINQYYNKKQSVLKNYVGGKGTSKKLKRLTHKRNCKVDDYLHKSTRKIINYCIGNDIKNIVVGKNKGWKKNLNIGKVNNQKFVSIPFNKLIYMLRYKGEEVGINLIEQEESYTSKCDALSLEDIKKHESYKGKRIKRGLFKSGVGKLINADVNASLNIGRKANVFQDFHINELLDRGVAETPFKINV